MISLDLARRLKFKLNSQKRIKVLGLGDIPSYITSRAPIKIILEWRVVYVMDVWVTTIGEGVDVLLGIDFMCSTGVRLGIREGMVGLPDEESILMYVYTIRNREYRDIPVCPLRGLHLRPGEHANVAIQYGQCRQLQDVTIQENTLSAKARVCQEAYEQMLWDAAPLAVMVPQYKWPTKLLVRPKEPERAQV
ncbi:hypothetical protein PHMEG_00030538 [Phytophthora megakarya]|uniref:Eukaryotic/viral aspartic protease n=1 Tax=Phytophthora megakarya TaxID=4795 RepID=A0A225V117_9STRA|nr:hypothetical protein PHMEG_00030538 [Phytophthora megakarya]